MTTRVPIKHLFAVSRNMVMPTDFGNDPLFHYSLPAWHEHGDGIIENAADLQSAKLLLKGGEVLVSKLNPEKSAVLLAEAHEIPTVCSPEFITLVPKKINSQFAYYFMLSAPLRHQLNASVESVTNSHKRARVDRFLASSVDLPDLATQRRIADFLDRETARIDLLIEKKQRLVALLGERLEAKVSQHTSPPSKDAAGWIERPIKEVCSVFGRIGFRGYTTEDIVDEGDGAITLGPSNLKGGRMTLEGRTYLSWRKYSESPEIQISLGDIVFVKTGSTIGKVAKVDELPEPMTLNPQLVVLKNVTCDGDFLLFAMQSRAFQYQVSFNRFGGSTPAMSQGHLGRLRVWLPENVDEQRKRARLC